jgi:TetR/AcrR family transcriptional regulator
MNAIANGSSHQASQEKTQDARDRILVAAQELFAKRGFEGVSTTEIAREAGITQPLIHYHFKNKEALWKATVARLFSRLQDEFLTTLGRVSRHDTRRYLAEIIRQYVFFSARYPEAGRFMLQEGGQESERLDWLTEHWMKPATREFRTVYEQASAEGWIKPVAFPQFVTLMTATCHQYFSLVAMSKSLFGADPTAADAQVMHCEMVVNTLLSSLLNEPEKALAW